jgi:hypothetical protein
MPLPLSLMVTPHHRHDSEHISYLVLELPCHPLLVQNNNGLPLRGICRDQGMFY